MHPNLADQCNVGRDSSMDLVPDNSIHDLQAAAPTAAGNGKSPTTYPESPPTSSDSMVDQCIVCLEDLCVASDCIVEHQEIVVAATTSTTDPENTEKQLPIAVIKPCGHSLHDECLREWTQKANSCPFCRQSFNLVEVLDKVGGLVLSEYKVENKKQVASTDFDPAWIEEPIEEEESTPCPICSLADNEAVLLLCDGCGAPYHTYCIGLSRVPVEDWYCMECDHDGTKTRAMELAHLAQPRRTAPRTQADARRNRRRIRDDHWFGAWSVFSSRVHEAAGLDLDFSDGEDENAMGDYRQLQRRTSGQAREFQRWQQRLNIASRQGARETFQTAPQPRRPRRPRTPPTPEETKEESRAWGDFERAKEMDGVPRTRKRKSRSAATSATASPVERPSEPERKLKRPRTRRVLVEGEASSSSSLPQPPRPSVSSAHPASPTLPVSDGPGPSFLTSLLKEVEMTVNSDDDTSRSAFSGNTISAGNNRVTSPSVEYSSPAASPSPPASTSHTPRALSITPPPHLAKRHASPRPLTSHVEPSYPRADYSPNRSPGESSKESVRPSIPTTELRQPRPRRQKPRPLALQRSPETSPVRETMSAEAKDSINRIVKDALKPHWQAAEITKEQYAGVNRDVSRKLYEMVADRDIFQNRERWEKVATAEVATAVKTMKG